MLQRAVQNAMAVFDEDTSLAMQQNTEYWHPSEAPVDLTGYYPIQDMFSCMPENPSGYSMQQFKSVLNAMGKRRPSNMARVKTHAC